MADKAYISNTALFYFCLCSEPIGFISSMYIFKLLKWIICKVDLIKIATFSISLSNMKNKKKVLKAEMLEEE